MKVLFDAGTLIRLLDPRTSDSHRERLDYLLAALQKSKSKILIPTPALSEFYVKATPEVLSAFKGRSAFIIVPFDEKAAVECAINVADALAAGNKKGVQSDAPWQKIKFDHQIVAIAKVNGATTIYSEDAGLRKFAASLGITALGTDDLPESPESKQRNLNFLPPDDTNS